MSEHKRVGRARLAGSIDGKELLGHLLTDTLGVIHLDRPLADFLAMSPKELLRVSSEKALSARCTDGAVQEYIIWSQVEAFLKKNVSLDVGSTSEQRQQAAMASFLSSERRCKRANKRLRHYRHHQHRNRNSSILEAAALILQRALPSVDQVYEYLLDHCTFGPGSTTAATYMERSLFYKVSSHQTATVRCREVFLDYIRRNPRWVASGGCNVEYTDYDVLAFVPKSATTDRTICKQPSINLFLQKGVESCLAACAKRVGITLNDQTRNGNLARIGSLHGSFVTVDLSAASDSISYELVKWLLPRDWFVLLDMLRTENTKLPSGEVVPLAKFSAMGNAFTFPLESLIFWAILMAARHHCDDTQQWRVYGDDIICAPRVALQLIEALQFAGFRPNVSKSFFFGNFRESCGFDFLGGLKVTPVYVRSTPATVCEVYNLHNRLLNHEWLRFPSTLRFLQRCVIDAHHGPWSQPREELGFWRLDFNPQLDAYFIGDPPDRSVWNPDLQRFEYFTSVITRSYGKLTFSSSTTAMHLILLGADVQIDEKEGYWIKDVSQPKLRQRRVAFAHWPKLQEVFQDKKERCAHGSLTADACLNVVELNRAARERVATSLLVG